MSVRLIRSGRTTIGEIEVESKGLKKLFQIISNAKILKKGEGKCGGSNGSGLEGDSKDVRYTQRAVCG